MTWLLILSANKTCALVSYKIRRLNKLASSEEGSSLSESISSFLKTANPMSPDIKISSVTHTDYTYPTFLGILRDFCYFLPLKIKHSS